MAGWFENTVSGQRVRLSVEARDRSIQELLTLGAIASGCESECELEMQWMAYERSKFWIRLIDREARHVS